MKTVLLDLFTSKKFLAAVTAIAVYVAGRFGFDLDTAVLDRIFAAFLVYVGAQGVADAGKSAAAINAVATSSGATSESLAAMKRVAGTVSVLALVVLGLAGASSLTACTTASLRQHGAASATGFLRCEASDLPPGTMDDAIDLAINGLARLIDGNGNVDTSKLKGDMSTARTDLKRCAIAGAVAALSSSSTARTLSGAPAVDTRLRGAFTLARQELGWLPVQLPDGTVL